MTEDQLIERAAAGDGRAIRTLYERYAPRVFAVVRRIAGDDELARDYAQEAWLRAVRALPSFRGNARFSTWLHRITVNAALQAVRKAERREGREIREGPSIAGLVESLPAAPVEATDVFLERRLEAAMARLPEGMRRVLLLHDVEGYTHDEIAELLGVAAGTSKSQLFKARARMRAILTESAFTHGAPRHREGAEA